MKQQLTSLIFEFPMKTVSEMNRRDHWRTVHKRKAAQQREVDIEWKRAASGGKVALPCRVVLTRIAPKTLDSDNLASAMKATRDQVARLLGVDDSPDSLAQFDCRQKAIGERKYSVRIEVVSL
jgi:hypothetical protein